MERRAFLRRSAMGGGALALGPGFWRVGCGDKTSGPG
ncbi:twin-arginine translocation signal domain-containing protein [Comamonas sp. JC664]|nr:twin-arginine translocation signal domain-containing protein [Comamonas sp. JC664]